MKLQLQNVGQATIVVKDLEGYTDFVGEVASGDTETYLVTRDLVQRLAPRLKEMEELVKATDGTVLVGLRWSVLLDDDDDDRAAGEGLAGLPALTVFQAASYATGAGATNVVATGTGLLGNQVKATLSIVEGTAQLDLEAVAPGAPGNAISFKLAAPAGGATVVGVVGNVITVTPLTGGDTVANIRDAINGDADAKLLVQASEGGVGSLTAEQDEANLDGGIGAGVSLTLGGTACVLSEVSDTQLTFDIPSGIAAASQIVPLEYRNGPHVSRLSVPVV
jgi:hypothetical protein